MRDSDSIVGVELMKTLRRVFHVAVRRIGRYTSTGAGDSSIDHPSQLSAHSVAPTWPDFMKTITWLGSPSLSASWMPIKKGMRAGSHGPGSAADLPESRRFFFAHSLTVHA